MTPPDITRMTFRNELSDFDYMMYRADMDARSRTSLMFIETLDRVPDLDRLRNQVDRASRVALRLRQRVVAPILPIAPARWVVDPDFDLDYHFRRVALPGKGTFRELLDLAETLHSTPLDLGRPLWEVTLVEGLDEGDMKAALCWKFSHTVTDGVAGMELDRMIHEASRELDPTPMPPLPVPEDLTSLDLTNRAAKRLPGAAVRRTFRSVNGTARLVNRTLRQPVGTVAGAAKVVNDLRKMADPGVEPSPLLARRGLVRRYDAFEFPLADIRAAAKAQGCSVNDAYLTGLASGLRRYHNALGVPVESLGVAMPVNARDAAATDAGNHWSAVTLRLPLGDDTTTRRMQKVREQVLTARDNASINPASLIAPLVAWLPHQMMAGAGNRAMGFDIQASNVPGHPTDRFIAGARITRSIPMGPLPGVAMMATMVSFSGLCQVGVHYDAAAFSDPDLLHECLQAGFDEVLESVHTTAETTEAGA